VKKGDLLMRIKPDNLSGPGRAAGSRSGRIPRRCCHDRAQLLKAQEDLPALEDIYEKKLVPDSDFTAAKTASEVAQANYDNALAQIRRAEGRSSRRATNWRRPRSTLRSTATISSLTSEKGERVVGTGQFAGTEVMRVANLEHGGAGERERERCRQRQGGRRRAS
jgi:HlyD family secretion protein